MAEKYFQNIKARLDREVGKANHALGSLREGENDELEGEAKAARFATVQARCADYAQYEGEAQYADRAEFVRNQWRELVGEGSSREMAAEPALE